MADIVLPVPGENPNWGTKLNTAILRINQELEALGVRVSRIDSDLSSVTLRVTNLEGRVTQLEDNLEDEVRRIAADVIASDPTIIEAAENAVDEALENADVLTVPRMHDEYGFEKDRPRDATVRVIVNAAGQMVAEMRDDENGWRWNTPMRIGNVYDLTPREDVGLGQPVVGSNGRMGEATTDADGNVPAWVLQRWKERMGLEGGVGNFRRLTVRPNPGSGEYASPKAANDAAASIATASTPVLIDVHPGVYTEVEWTVNPHVTIRGRD